MQGIRVKNLAAGMKGVATGKEHITRWCNSVYIEWRDNYVGELAVEDHEEWERFQEWSRDSRCRHCSNGLYHEFGGKCGRMRPEVL